MAYTMKVGTYSLATLLNLISLEPKGITTRQLKDKYSALEGFPLGDAIKGHDHFLTKSGNNRATLNYKITKAGRQYIKAHSDEIQEDLDAVKPILKEKRPNVSKAMKNSHAKRKQQQLDIVPPSPVYSPAAQEAMNLLSTIVDANEQARKALEQVHMTVAGYFNTHLLDDLPKDAGPFQNVVDEMMEFRTLLESIKEITEPDTEEVHNEQGQASLIG